MNRRSFLLTSSLALPSFFVLLPGADASTSRLLTLEELLDISTYVVVATAGESKSLWEELPSGRRIVTYTRLAVERAVAGKPGSEVWVRTLGGVVDKIGQSVPGEARIASGSRALLFLAEVRGVTVVASMAQGHYPVVLDDQGKERLAGSPDVGMLLPRPGPSVSARERIAGSTMESTISLVQQIRKARDEKK